MEEFRRNCEIGVFNGSIDNSMMESLLVLSMFKLFKNTFASRPIGTGFYGDLIYKFKKIVGRADFSDQFRKIIVRYKRIGYNINIMQQSACLVFNPVTVINFASLFNCTPVGRASDIKLFILVGLGRSFFVCCLAHRGSTVGFLLLQCSSGVVWHPGDLRCRSQHVPVESSSLLHHSIYL